jgi:ABC-2 type transport system permease protein
MKSNNFRDLLTVTKFTMRDMLGRKSFRISTIIIVVLIVLGFNVPNFINSINGGDFSDTMILSDPENLYNGALDSLNQAEDSLGYKFDISSLNADEIKAKVNDGEVSSAIIINRGTENNINLNYIVKNSATAIPPTAVLDTLNSLYVNLQIQKLNLSAEQLAKISPEFQVNIEQTEDQEVGGNIFVMMLLSCVLFFAIYFCAYQVSSSITIEKTSKIMETLVTSTNPRTIVLGKTIGIGLVGLMQIVLFAIVAIISAYSFLNAELLENLFDMSSFTPYLAIIMIIYFILGYFAYALMYALTGSTVSKPEDIQSANTPIAIITMIGFYLAYFTLTDPTGNLNLFAALLPISSPFCMPLRVMMGIAGGWEVAFSIIILVAACAIIAHIAIKIYSNAILNYGTKMSLKDIIRTYKEK